MKLFDVVPNDLFSVLASPNRVLYADALAVLYDAYRETLKVQFLSGLLEAFVSYDALHGEATTMRAFSAKCYQDSKQFEHKFRDEFLHIAMQYCDDLREICEQHELGVRDKQAYLGIYARPELYEFSGKCFVVTDTGEVDISPLYPLGIALPSTTVHRINRLQLYSIHKVIFIKNKTNYNEFLFSEMQPDELVLYHGGFLSPQKRKFFKKIAALYRQILMCYWANIDLGGFQMFLHLRAIFPNLIPMSMDGTQVNKYKALGLRACLKNRSCTKCRNYVNLSYKYTQI